MKFVDSFDFQKMMRGVLRWIGRQTPNIPFIRAIPNRILKPLHFAMGLNGGVVNVLGFKMYLEPSECVDGNLWFSPQLYDRAEIRFLLARMPHDGVFVDVGANIGFWALYFSYFHPKSRICAIEANPATFTVLLKNIEINAFRNILPILVGVSDHFGELPLYCNDNGNRGADSFADYANDRARRLMVDVKPLLSILISSGEDRIDVMKIDIEGFEDRVLMRFFSEAPNRLWPHFICAEISRVPQVIPLLQNKGYRTVFSAGENCVFELLFPDKSD